MLAAGFASALHGQATISTASRTADVQVGLGISAANPDYSPAHFYGGTIYATVDFREHFGAELNIRQLNTTEANKLSERTYEIGGRYVRHYGIFHPYARLSVGRGVFNFLNDSANLAYNMYSAGLGVDVNVTRKINARADYEYQRWSSFPPRGLQPNIITVGAAYHF